MYESASDEDGEFVGFTTASARERKKKLLTPVKSGNNSFSEFMIAN